MSSSTITNQSDEQKHSKKLSKSERENIHEMRRMEFKTNYFKGIVVTFVVINIILYNWNEGLKKIDWIKLLLFYDTPSDALFFAYFFIFTSIYICQENIKAERHAMMSHMRMALGTFYFIYISRTIIYYNIRMNRTTQSSTETDLLNMFLNDPALDRLSMWWNIKLGIYTFMTFVMMT